MADDDDSVTLQCADGVTFDVKVRTAKMSVTVRDLIDDAGIKDPIVVPNVSSEIMSKVVTYCAKHENDPPLGPRGDPEDICPWDRAYCDVDMAVLFELIQAADYLDIQPLMELTCKTVANMINGKTAEQVRETFNVKSDFTPEEEEQIRKENAWCDVRCGEVEPY